MEQELQDLQEKLRAKMFNAKLKDVSSGTGHSLHLCRKALNSATLSEADVTVLNDIANYFENLGQPVKKAS